MKKMKEKQKLDAELKRHRIISILWTVESSIVNSSSQDEYEVTYEDIDRIAESIEDDIQWDTYEIIYEYIEEYLRNNKWFDLTPNK